MSDITLSKEASASKWIAKVEEGAEAHLADEKVRFKQEQAVKRGREIMLKAGVEQEHFNLFSSVRQGLRTRRDAGRLMIISGPIEFPHETSYARILETQDLTYYNHLRLLGGIALAGQPEPGFVGRLHVIEFSGEADKAKAANDYNLMARTESGVWTSGEFTSYVSLPDFMRYRANDDYAVGKLDEFMVDMQALSVTLGLDPNLEN